jgi:DNA-binding CsgD family transcriptional regulator
VTRGGIPPAVWLTKSEQRLLELFAAHPGANKELAQQLGLAPGTVRNAIAGVCRKLGVDGRLKLLVWCLRNPQAIERGVFRPEASAIAADDPPVYRSLRPAA